jgi:arsenate reductase
MAEGFAKELGKDLIEVRSGGIEEGTRVDPIAIEVMKEKGIDISSQTSKIVESWDWADSIIDMGCDAAESCPVIYHPRIEKWDIENPKGKPIEEYRKVRDIIEKKVRELIEYYN